MAEIFGVCMDTQHGRFMLVFECEYEVRHKIRAMLTCFNVQHVNTNIWIPSDGDADAAARK